MINRLFSFFFVTAILLLNSLSASGQEKCGSPAYMNMQKDRHPHLPEKHEFENWIQRKQALLRQKNSTQRSLRQQYVLPVVIHVIHQGEPVGTGTNIPESQILSQLRTLNTDFRRMNEAQINQLPPEFRALAADTEIEFVLAKQTPEGLPTNGITRTRGPKNTYSMKEDAELKSLIHWDPENYINIYVVDIANDVIGYAQFPETDKLEGLELGQVSDRTDGVVIDYKYFGSGGSAVPASLGRTLTHELGHFFGLRHTWGDGGCDVDDFVTDTPLSSEDYDGFSNCTARPVSCQGADMFQNFLTYASDACMALFTEGQKERILVVLENSPRRKTLNNSYAKEEPTIVADDAGIALFTILITDPCTKSFIPSVTVRNYGDNQIESLSLSVLLNGVVVNTKQLNGLQLNYLATLQIELDPVVPPTKGELNVGVRINSVNGRMDNKVFNNLKTTELFAPYLANLPFLQTFETTLIPFYRINPDFFLTWQVAKAPISGNPDNLAAFMNYYNYEQNEGSKDLLISPIFNLEGNNQAFLNFRYAYAQYLASDMDGLEIYITSDCSESIENAVKIFDIKGSSLATAPPTSESFVPAGNEHWKTVQLDLSPFIGLENLQIIFAGVNDYGNNLYLDNIEVLTEVRKETDLSILNIDRPSVVSCTTSPEPEILFRNVGTKVIESFEAIYSIDGKPWQKVIFPGLSILPLESIQLSTPKLPNLAIGRHLFKIRITSVNGEFDDNPLNDIAEKAFAINTALDSIPLRQLFIGNPPLNDSWVNISPDPTREGWVYSPLRGAMAASNGSAFFSEFYQQPKGHENWLVSPTLDLSEVEEAGVLFRHSYAPLSTAFDVLQVRVSTDCGNSWSNILYEKGGAALSSRKTTTKWIPNSEDDWDESFVDLSEFVGLPDVRVAFVAISDGGNNIYLDHIEFYQSNVPLPLVLPQENSFYVAPNPATFLNPPFMVFNLKERENVHVQVYTIRGELVLEEILPNILNQKITIDVEGWTAGMYFVQAQSPHMKESFRFVLLR